MKNQTVGSIAKLANADIYGPKIVDVPVTDISNDTRTIHPGAIYMPIIGENLDGHAFIDKAFRKGAVASFTDHTHLDPDTEQTLLAVTETTEALQTLAMNYRKSLPMKVIGITGSNGKTTTKDILYSVLKQQYITRKTMGNLNNHIGVPKTLLDFDEDTEMGIVEMGMDRFKDISKLVEIADPEIGIITNIGDSHLEVLKTRENVAKAKLEIIEGLTEENYFIYNYDDEVLRNEVSAMTIRPKVITYGKDPSCDYVIEVIRTNESGSTFKVNGEQYHINLIGNFQCYNATVAIIVGKLYGLSDDQIHAGLHVEETTAMRTEIINCAGFDILNDCYKSNPQSLKEALETIGLLAGYTRKIAILGDMLELGENEAELHRRSGRQIDPNTIDYVLLFGPLSKYMMEGALENFPANRVLHFDTKEDLIDRAKYLITKSSIVLVKASRSMKFEQVIEGIRDITIY